MPGTGRERPRSGALEDLDASDDAPTPDPFRSRALTSWERTRRGRTAREAPAVAVAVAVVVVVRVVADLLAGSAVSAAQLAGLAVAATLAIAGARGLGSSRWGAAVAAALALVSPLALAASAVAGAGLLALILGSAVVAVAGCLVPRAWRPAVPLVLLAACPLVALAVGAGTGVGAAGWSAGWTSASAASTGPAALGDWARTDPVLPWLALCGAVALLALPGRRVLGAAGLAAAAVVVVARLPVTALVVTLPLAGLVVAGGAEAGWSAASGAGRAGRSRRPSGRRAGHRAETSAPLAPALRHRAPVAAVALAAAVAVLAPLWTASLRSAPATGSGSPLLAMTDWLSRRVPAGQLAAVEPDVYSRLTDSGQATEALVPLTGSGGAPRADRPVTWLVSTAELREDAGRGTWAARALATSTQVASFGSGSARVALRRLSAIRASAPTTTAPQESTSPSPTPSASRSATASSPASSSAPAAPAPAAPPASTAPVGAVSALAGNPDLTLSVTARRQLTTLPVDARLTALLAQLAGSERVSVTDLPVTSGDSAGAPRRAVVIDALDGQPVAAGGTALASLQAQFAAQDPLYRPTTSLLTGATGAQLLVVLPRTG